MDIDPDISNWVLEFLLREPLKDQTLNSLLRTLPIPSNRPDLQKSLLLKKLESEISSNSISESALEFLEQLEELEFTQGSGNVSDSLKRAYCAVAVQCTVKHLEDNDCDKFEFFKIVKSVWRGRVERMGKVLGKDRLGSEELWVWKDEIEAAVWDEDVCRSVVEKSKAVNAVEEVMRYLREEREKMGPSFLELVAEKVKDDEVLQGILAPKGADQIVAKEATLCPMDKENGKSKGAHEENIQPRNKLVGSKRSRGLSSGNSRGVKIVDPDETPVDLSHKDCNLPCTAEVNRVREALRSSSLELQVAVTDPLPDALRMAEAVSGMERGSKDHDPDYEKRIATNMLDLDPAGVDQHTQHDVPRLSLMERKSSAHTYQWDESIDTSPENCSNKLRLPSPRIVNVSPLNQYEMNNQKQRRKRRIWSALEEDTLRDGVKKYGVGKWKAILSAYRDIFEDRTDNDLKDKWRNLTR